MKDYKSLKLLDYFSFIFKKLDIDYTIMRKIIQLKLNLDERRVPTIINSEEKKEGNFFMKSLFIYLLTGLLFMAIVMLDIPIFIKMSISIGAIIFMLSMTMISDFSSILLDTKDRNILMTKPVDFNTLNTARIIHIFIYLFFITMSISGPTLIYGTIKYKLLFFVIFFLVLISISLFIIFITSLLYLLILNFFDGEKLKDVINYFQIIFSITMTISYQFIGNMFEVFENNIVLSFKWWIYLLPSAWFSALFEVFINNNFEKQYIYLSILSFLVPFLSLILYIKIIVPYFEQNISKLNSGYSKKNNINYIGLKTQNMISKILCSDNIENIFFRFTQTIISNERNLKLKIYPSIAFAILIPFIMIFKSFNKFDSFSNMITHISNGKSYFYIYISISMLSSLIVMITTSENYKGAWIYKALPINNITSVYKGAFKGFLLKYIIPPYLFINLIFFMIFKFKILFNLILMFLNMMLLTLFIFNNSSKELPFSRKFDSIKENSSSLGFLALIFCTVLGGIHFLLELIGHGLLIYSIGILISIIFLWKKTFN